VRSHLVAGKVRHSRARPTRYDLEHDVFYFALDLDELDEVQRRTRLVRRNRRALFSFRDADYMPTPAPDLPAAMRAHLRAEGLELATSRITLVTNLRLFGYVFNPASFYLCRDEHGTLRAVVIEVHNTYGERHLYTLRPEAPGGKFSAGMDKAFFVSPFIGLEGRYRVSVRDEAGGLYIGINLREGGEHLLSTSLALRRLPLTSRTLLRLLSRNPLVTHKTIVMIHWHALRLWLRRVPFYRHRAAQRAVAGSSGTGR
jgi:DUF1365 family protein